MTVRNCTIFIGTDGQRYRQGPGQGHLTACSEGDRCLCDTGPWLLPRVPDSAWIVPAIQPPQYLSADPKTIVRSGDVILVVNSNDGEVDENYCYTVSTSKPVAMGDLAGEEGHDWSTLYLLSRANPTEDA